MTFNNIKIGIIGHGFVGEATEKGFPKINDKFIVDPKHGTDINKLKKFKPDFIFICVPTPMNIDGSQDSSIVFDVFSKLKNNFKGVPKILKSTFLPNNLSSLNSEIDSLVYNPEFLREKHAEEDFINSPFVILGGDKIICKRVESLYKNYSACKTKNYIFVDIETASLIKYSINSYLASKVLFFNGIRDIFDNLKSEIDWDDFIQILSLDKRIGNSHMSVPGHDGKKGFGGACFTKDTAAFLKYSEEIGEKFLFLDSAININNSIRSKYDELDQREKEQNVNYDSDN